MKSIQPPYLPVRLQAALGLLLAATLQAQPTNTPAPAPLPVVGVSQIFKAPTNYIGRKFVLEGFVTDVCKHRGCWALLHDNDPDAKGQIRAKQDESGPAFTAFRPELQGRTIRVTGELHETRIDKAYLDKWEARVKAAQTASRKNDDAEQPSNAVLAQIARLREQLAKSGEDYLSSLGLAVVKWEVKADDQPEPKASSKSKRS
jgi:hypothetical protein